MVTVLRWPTRRPPQPLDPNQIHVWAWSLDHPRPDLERSHLLDRDELDRWRSFRFERDRTRFFVAHVTLRLILAAYLEEKPEDLKFERSPFGKPQLIWKTHPKRQLHFNLSHSGTAALAAISSGGPVGIDIEQIAQAASNEPEVAETHFSTAERAELGTFEGSLWLEGFYHCWTQKEALLKAEGVGLNLNLASFDVSVDPRKPAGLICSRTGMQASWNLRALSPGAGMMGAIAYQGAQTEVACFQFAAPESCWG